MGFLTPNANGEHALLRTFVMQQLAELRATVVGLTDEQAHSTPTASTLSLSTLLRHCGPVALFWSAAAQAAPGRPTLPDDIPHGLPEDFAEDSSSLDDVLAVYDRCVALTEQNIDAIDDLSVKVPAPPAHWIPKEITHWEARWCLLHLVEELARHAGHADIIRETIDGRKATRMGE